MEAYLLIFFMLLALELSYFKVAHRYNIIDKPNGRSSHTMITLRGGGIVFYFAAILYFIFYGFSYPLFIISLSLISIISFIDDLRSVPAKLRLAVQILCVSLVLYELGVFQMGVGLILFSLFIGVGILNAYNFMDGINGMTGGNNLVLFLTLWYINEQVRFTDSRFILVIIASLVIFNFFNFRTKAKCFAGDVGALALGTIVLFLMGKLVSESGNYTYFLLLAVYGIETGLTITHRLFLKENILRPHRKHAFQLLANELGWKHLSVSILYAMIQLTINLGLLTIGKSYPNLYFWSVCMVLVLAYYLFVKRFIKLHE